MNGDALGRWADVSDSSEDDEDGVPQPQPETDISSTKDDNKYSAHTPPNAARGRFGGVRGSPARGFLPVAPRTGGRDNGGRDNRDVGRDNRDVGRDNRDGGRDNRDGGRDNGIREIRRNQNKEMLIALPQGTIGLDILGHASRVANICPSITDLKYESDLKNECTWVTGTQDSLKQIFNVLCKRKGPAPEFQACTDKPSKYNDEWTRGSKVAPARSHSTNRKIEIKTYKSETKWHDGKDREDGHENRYTDNRKDVDDDRRGSGADMRGRGGMRGGRGGNHLQGKTRGGKMGTGGSGRGRGLTGDRSSKDPPGSLSKDISSPSSRDAKRGGGDKLPRKKLEEGWKQSSMGRGRMQIARSKSPPSNIAYGGLSTQRKDNVFSVLEVTSDDDL